MFNYDAINTLYRAAGRAEKLKILNIRPQYPVDVQVLIEETEERFEDKEIQTILEIVNRLLPSIVKTDDNNENDTDNNMEHN